MMIQRSFEIRRAENARQKASANVELGNSRFSNASSDWYEKKMNKNVRERGFSRLAEVQGVIFCSVMSDIGVSSERER